MSSYDAAVRACIAFQKKFAPQMNSRVGNFAVGTTKVGGRPVIAVLCQFKYPNRVSKNLKNEIYTMLGSDFEYERVVYPLDIRFTAIPVGHSALT